MHRRELKANIVFLLIGLILNEHFTDTKFASDMMMVLNEQRNDPGRGGQTEVTPDQTSFERTHVPDALELHGLEKASSALLSGQWSGTCMIRGHFVLGQSDQRALWSGTV